jgi:hypothetical protein
MDCSTASSYLLMSARRFARCLHVAQIVMSRGDLAQPDLCRAR